MLCMEEINSVSAQLVMHTCTYLYHGQTSLAMRSFRLAPVSPDTGMK